MARADRDYLLATRLSSSGMSNLPLLSSPTNINVPIPFPRKDRRLSWASRVSEHGVEHRSSGRVAVRYGVDGHVANSRSEPGRRQVLLLLLLLLAQDFENHVDVSGHLLLQPRQLPTTNQPRDTVLSNN